VFFLPKIEQNLTAANLSEHEVKCWTCFTLDTLEVSTNNCNKTLCTGKQISACYKWHVSSPFD